ncbi:MAG TPA: LamG-like jellyroll fold domain-containing protein [Planctomycetota bacterium]|nr:LamG-like jellyroll fold domain-containing protein [Planctomycetota bacterium]
MRLTLLVACPCLIGGVVPCQNGPQVTLVAHLDEVDARWHGAQPIVDGARGRAARFDGKAACIDVGSCPISSAEPFTLRCQLRTTTGEFCTPLMARAGEAVALSLVLGRSPGVISFEAWSWQSARVPSQVRVDDGAWHAIEVAYDPNSTIAMLFVDGVQQGFAELGAGEAPQAQLRLGNNIGANQPFAGDLDEVEVLRTATHTDAIAAVAPVLPLAERQAALRQLREHVLPKVTPSLAGGNAAAWPARRLAVRAHVADALGLSPPPASVPLDVRVHAELVRDGVRLQRISWVGFAGQRATGWLWLPDGAAPAGGRRPAILCPHGHWPDGARHPVVQARCAAFARFGWIALAVDSVHVEHVASGVNSVGAMTWHNQRAIDLLIARDDVDAARIAVTGASGGAQQSYYLMALEDRLAAAAPMVMACYLTEIVSDTSAHCGCNHVPRLAAGTDVPEMCAVFAPRPVMFGSVSGDWTHNFPREGLPELQAHWARLHGPAPRSRFAEEGHNYDRPMREQVYAFLQDVLQGPAADAVARTNVAEPAGGVFSMHELQPLWAACPAVQLDPDVMAAEYLARRAKVGSLAELAPGLDLHVVAHEVEWLDTEASEWRRGRVRGGDGVPIPLRCKRTQAAPTEPYTVVVDPGAGAADRADAPAWFSALARPVTIGPRPYGEWSAFRSAWQRNGLLLGRGEGYQAALDTALVCASLPGTAPVHVIGLGEAGVVALLAAHLCPRIVHVAVDDLGASYAEQGNRWPLCPELLRFRDLPELIATLPKSCSFEQGLGGAAARERR